MGCWTAWVDEGRRGEKHRRTAFLSLNRCRKAPLFVLGYSAGELGYVRVRVRTQSATSAWNRCFQVQVLLTFPIHSQDKAE